VELLKDPRTLSHSLYFNIENQLENLLRDLFDRNFIVDLYYMLCAAISLYMSVCLLQILFEFWFLCYAKYSSFICRYNLCIAKFMSYNLQVNLAFPQSLYF
jgi:hypothetical protein